MVAITGRYLELVVWILMIVQAAISAGGRTGASLVAPTTVTWYIRADDGGTPAQCDGKGNAAYPGSGSGLHCAYKALYYMATNNTSSAAFSWRSAPGDHIKYGDTAEDTAGNDIHGGGIVWLPCGSHSELCEIGAPPNGTVIEGVNSSSCSDPFTSANRIKGVGDGLFEMLDFQGTSDITVNCIGIYSPDDCSAVVGAGQCAHGTNNWVQHGIRFQYLNGKGPTRLTLMNMFVVGMASQCMLGSGMNTSSGDTTTVFNVHLDACGAADWDWDGGLCAANACASVGNVNFTGSTVNFSGCVNSTSPITTEAAILPDHCAGQSNGGYGDGFAIGVSVGNTNVTICNNSFSFNIQDAIDTLHANDTPGNHANIVVCFNITNGNGGQMLKFGAADTNTGYGNNLNGACAEMSLTTMAPMNTWPSSYHTNLNNADLCRANDQIVFALKSGSVTTFIANTMTGQNTVGYDVGCAPGITVCTIGTIIKFQDNISIGFGNPLNGGTFPAGWFENGLSSGGNSDPLGNSGSLMNHNIWFHQSTGCPQSSFDTPGSLCGTDPQLVNQGVYTIDPHLSGGSPAIGAGILTFVTQDLFGNPFSNPPSIGAVQ